MSPGELQETKRPFDLAIDGPGLFVLRVNSAEQDLYTRNGRFTVDLQRRLGIVRDDEICLLQPVLTLPEETVSVKIGADGVVTATFVDQVEEQTVGQLKLAIFVDQSHLAPMGSSLLIAPPEIVPRLVNPGSNSAGVIRQGYLEQSNVDVNRELADREQWESILRSLPTTDLPRTARDATRSQN
jgi:flagellar basal-body rod protein FlgG